MFPTESVVYTTEQLGTAAYWLKTVGENAEMYLTVALKWDAETAKGALAKIKGDAPKPNGTSTPSAPQELTSLQKVLAAVSGCKRDGMSRKAVVDTHGWQPIVNCTPQDFQIAVAYVYDGVPLPGNDKEPPKPTNGHSSKQEAAQAEAIAACEPKFEDPLPNVPAAMKAKRQWVRWRLETRNGRPTKVPYRVDGKPAASDNPNDWTDYRTVVTGATINREQGVGFMFADGFAGIDLDGCRNPKTNEIKAWAQEILDMLGDAYVEESPSGTGLHVIVLGKVPGVDKKFNLDPAIGYGKAAIEIYDTRRYFTVTGETYFEEAGDIHALDLTEVYAKFHELRKANPAPRNERADAADAANVGTENKGKSVQAVWHGMFHSTKYDIFKKGEILNERHPFRIDDGYGRLEYDTPSEADMAFCTVTAFMYQSDPTVSNLEDKIWEEYTESSLARDKWLNREEDFRRLTIAKAIDSASKIKAKQESEAIVIPSKPSAETKTAQAEADAATAASENATGTFPHGDDNHEEIPDFEESLIVGTGRKLVDAICQGTTIPRQYGLHAAKVIACSILTKYKIELEDCESARTYFIVFGATGTGKGLAFRRLRKIVDQTQNVEEYVKIITAIDSEAGLRDAFFEIPESKNRPILYFVDEVKMLGQKADGRKNPEIVSSIIELANSTTVGRVKAKKRVKEKAEKSRSDSWLLMYMCAQDGEAYATAFPRTKAQGLPDRFIPEYSPKVKAGRLPEPDMAAGTGAVVDLLGAVCRLKGKMTMSDDVRKQVEEVWSQQPDELQMSPRLRQQFLLEMYLAAFFRGSAVAEAEDLAVAVKALHRQNAIRREFFADEMPDVIGVLSNRIKTIHKDMLHRLRSGSVLEDVALTKRDIATQVEAYKDNEMPNFDRAWNGMKSVFVECTVKSAKNGHTYKKFIPLPEETDTWLPPEWTKNTVLG
jgi:hypothetical protein